MKTNNKPIIGYITGTFDILHYGHLNIIKKAAKKVDKLIVGIHESGERKGVELFMSLNKRREAVEAISFVDETIITSGRDDEDWNDVKYDYLFVGDDYKDSQRFYEFEKSLKGKAKIIYLPRTKGISSTLLRKKLNNI